MNVVFRVTIAPAIVSSYTTYGVISAAKRRDGAPSKSALVRDLIAGGLAGFAYGSYYVATGKRLDSFLFKDNP